MAADEAPSDAEALRRLARGGSDLSKLHRFEFNLRFPTEDAAAGAVAQLEELAFNVTLERDDADDTWVLIAAKVMYPVESNIAGLRGQLKTVAAQNQGVYEGWRAKQMD